MAKALVNKGIPIKADNPKDPYIRDENGIKDIVDSSTVFGKTLGTANGKLQLKNGNTVLSEVTPPAPDLSDYGKTLAISGQDLSLKNGNTVLSTVTLPGGGGGGSSAGVFTYTANFVNNGYYLDSPAVATEIFNKLNNNEDVQIVLAKDGNKYIARCTGYDKGIWDEEEQEWMSDPSYHFSCIVYDLRFLVLAFDISSGNTYLDITEHGLN